MYCVHASVLCMCLCAQYCMYMCILWFFVCMCTYVLCFVCIYVLCCICVFCTYVHACVHCVLCVYVHTHASVQVEDRGQHHCRLSFSLYLELADWLGRLAGHELQIFCSVSLALGLQVCAPHLAFTGVLGNRTLKLSGLYGKHFTDNHLPKPALITKTILTKWVLSKMAGPCGSW